MSASKDNKKRESTLVQIQKGIEFSKRALEKKVTGFNKGMRVVHHTYGAGKLIMAEDKKDQFQSYLMELDVAISLGAGERLKRAWVWPGHLSVEEKQDKLKQIKKTKKEIDNVGEPKSKPRKRRTRKKGAKKK